ncbi:MAG: hypothetical protein D6723_10660 [Acidobacteria bacterium]|nr:MAG: hypothetical protein D6723_10660 [Acidobacteriota bacterium]
MLSLTMLEPSTTMIPFVPAPRGHATPLTKPSTSRLGAYGNRHRRVDTSLMLKKSFIGDEPLTQDLSDEVQDIIPRRGFSRRGD